MTSKPRLLVVGGSGFIGGQIVGRGLELGWSVTNLSLGRGTRHTPGAEYISADITDLAAIRKSLENRAFEFVVNCGGYIDHTLFHQGGRSLIEAHFSGVINLVECLDRRALQSFVNIGSSDEYGSAPAPQVESQREAPVSPYSLGKLAATHFLQMLHRTEQFPATTLRLFLTYGPGQNDRRFLPQIVRGCLSGKSFPVSAGEQLRDFCFIGDTVAAVFATFTSMPARGEVLNVGSGHPVTIRSVIDTVRGLIGRGDPQFGMVAYRPGESMELYPSIAKAESVIGWKPKVTLVEGLTVTIRSIELPA